MPIHSSITKLLAKAVGSSAIDASILRTKPEFDKVAAAGAINSLQRQIDQLKSALATEQTIQEFEVTDSNGGLIAWIGSKVVAGVTYLGGWFKQIYIGGTSAATAKIVADANGNVTITGASIILIANGVTTIINNINGISGEVESLVSKITGATGAYTSVTPFSFFAYFWDPVLLQFSPVATLRDVSGAGRLTLANVANSNNATLATGGAGSPFLSITDGTTQVLLSSGLGLSIAGTSAISATRSGDLVNLAISGNFTGTHAQNVGTTDSPTFANVTTSGGNLNAVASATSSNTSDIAAIQTDLILHYVTFTTMLTYISFLQSEIDALDARISAAHTHGAGSYVDGATLPVTGTSGSTAL
jgi:hypothetical protein